MKNILLIQGHPDNTRGHFCHALAGAYGQAARAAGHDVRELDIASLDVPLLRDPQDWESGTAPASLLPAQGDIAWAQHIVIFFPLWLGDMPALVKAFFEQVLRPGFAFRPGPGNPFRNKALKGRTARLVVTMGMPSAVYRLFFRAHSIKSLERNILGFVGIAPVEETLVGSVARMGPATAQRWIAKLQDLGRDGQ